LCHQHFNLSSISHEPLLIGLPYFLNTTTFPVRDLKVDTFISCNKRYRLDARLLCRMDIKGELFKVGSRHQHDPSRDI
jgi:hypothetical protein